jgi:parallel beta-helix repeat protein
MNAAAWIGFASEADTVASPNLITGNGTQGIAIRRGAFVRIIGNQISHNNANGILVAEAASAQISDNTIDGNGMDGIVAQIGSGVTLGADTGDTIFTRPNSTTINNSGFGIRCRIGGYAEGRLGTLNGASGRESYSEGCVNSLIP